MASITRGLLTKDINGAASYGLPFTNTTQSVYLTAGAAQSVNVPKGAEIAFFASTCDFFVDPTGATAVVPSGSWGPATTTLNPVERYVTGVSSLSVISVEDGYVSIDFYRLSNATETGLT